MKVLLVDDSGLARRRARQMLEGDGYEVIEAEDGMVALERFCIDKPDLVVLDLVMRGMYGLDVLNKLRQLDPEVRVVVVSADVQESSQQMVHEAGARAFLVKPIERETMLATVRGALEGTL